MKATGIGLDLILIFVIGLLLYQAAVLTAIKQVTNVVIQMNWNQKPELNVC